MLRSNAREPIDGDGDDGKTGMIISHLGVTSARRNCIKSSRSDGGRATERETRRKKCDGDAGNETPAKFCEANETDERTVDVKI